LRLCHVTKIKIAWRRRNRKEAQVDRIKSDYEQSRSNPSKMNLRKSVTTL